MLIAKSCAECGGTKPLAAFHRDNSKPDGRTAKCAACRRKARHQYERDNPLRGREYRAENRDKITAYVRAWRAANPEKAKATTARRRARVRGQAVGDVDYERILARDGFRCYLCETAVEPEDVHFDHVIPLARGGSHSEDNIRVTHKRCNQLKGCRLLPEHLQGDPAAYERINDPVLLEHVRVTACPKGHPYEGENLVINKHGYQVCRACRNDRAREAQRQKKGYYTRDRSCCPHGHEWTPENTYVSPKGRRYCRECNRAAARARHARRAA